MRQKVFEIIGGFGCYFLCILKLCEERIGVDLDVEKAYQLAVRQGWMDTDCYMRYPEKLLSHYRGGKWKPARKESVGYVPKPGELCVQRYELAKTMETKSHFVLAEWDPYGDSETRLKGELVSWRIFEEDV